MTPDINLVVKLLQDRQRPVSDLPVQKIFPENGVIRPPDTGDDSVLPPDPGYMGNMPPYLNVAQRNQMPFPNNHNPNTDFANRWPQNLPPAGILNDLKPMDLTPQLIRKLPNG